MHSGECRGFVVLGEDNSSSNKNHIVWSMIALGYPELPGVLLQKNEKVVKYVCKSD